MFHVDRRKMQRWKTTPACLMMDAERSAFKQLLALVKRLHDARTNLCKGHGSVVDMFDGVGGWVSRPRLTLDAGPATGCSIGTAVGDPPPCCVIGALEAVPPNGRQDHQRFVITRGSRLTAMGSRPTAMGQQTGNVVRECMRQIMSLQPDERSTVDAMFPQDAFSARPTCTD